MTDIAVRDNQQAMQAQSVHQAQMSFNDMQQMSRQIVQSGLFPVLKSEQQAFGVLMIAQAENKQFLQVLREYDFIPGRMPAKKAIAILADFQANGGQYRYIEYTHQAVEMWFGYNGTEVTVRWDREMAEASGYAANNKQYQMNPRRMYASRCATDGVKAVMPGIMVGIYSPEEVADMEYQESAPKPAQVYQPAEPSPADQAKIDKQARARASRGFLETLTNAGHPEMVDSPTAAKATLLAILKSLPDGEHAALPTTDSDIEWASAWAVGTGGVETYLQSLNMMSQAAEEVTEGEIVSDETQPAIPNDSNDGLVDPFAETEDAQPQHAAKEQKTRGGIK